MDHLDSFVPRLFQLNNSLGPPVLQLQSAQQCSKALARNNRQQVETDCQPQVSYSVPRETSSEPLKLNRAVSLLELKKYLRRDIQAIIRLRWRMWEGQGVPWKQGSYSKWRHWLRTYSHSASVTWVALCEEGDAYFSAAICCTHQLAISWLYLATAKESIQVM